MAWGGGWGGGGGGAMFGGRGNQPGLPFGGIPSELAVEAEKLLQSEPEHPKSNIPFHQRPGDAERQRRSNEAERIVFKLKDAVR